MTSAKRWKYFELDVGRYVSDELAYLPKAVKGAEGISYKYCFGERVGSDHPRDAAMHMVDEFPGIRLGGLIGSRNSFMIVCGAIKDLILAHDRKHEEMELLPVSIINHKGRVASADYWIINPLGTVPCLDQERSEIKRMPPPDNDVYGVGKKVLHGPSIDPDRAVFRVPEDKTCYIARQDWLLKLNDLGLEVPNVYGENIEVYWP